MIQQVTGILFDSGWQAVLSRDPQKLSGVTHDMSVYSSNAHIPSASSFYSLYDILSGIQSGILSLTFDLTFHLTFSLASFLAS